MNERPLTYRHWIFLVLVAALVPLVLWISTVLSPPEVISGPVERAAKGSPLPIEHWAMENGATVYFVPKTHLPILDIWFLWDAGSARDTRPGEAAMAQEVWLHESATLSADDIAERLESVGIEKDTDVDPDVASVHFRTLTDADALDTLFDVIEGWVKHPQWTAETVAFVQKQHRTFSQLHAQDPNFQVRKAFREMLYEDHPYGHMTMGTVEDIDAIDLLSIEHFLTTYYVPANLTVVVVGDLSAGHVDERLRNLFEGVASGRVAPPLPPAPEINYSDEAIAFPSSQSHLRFGFPLLAKADPDTVAMEVLAHILGGDMSSRLFTSVRKERGLAYSVYARAVRWKAGGPFVIGLQTRQDQAEQAIETVQMDWLRLLENGPTEAELVKAKNTLAGQYQLLFSNNAWVGSLIQDMAINALPIDYYEGYLQTLEALQLEDLQRVLLTRVPSGRLPVLQLGLGDAS